MTALDVFQERKAAIRERVENIVHLHNTTAVFSYP